MSLRGRPLASRLPRHMVGTLVIGLALALSASTAQALPDAVGGGSLPRVADNPDPIKGTELKSKPRPVDKARTTMANRLGPAAWPRAGSVDLTLAAAASALTGKGGSTAAEGRIGDLPIAVSPTAAERRTAAAAPPGRVKVASLGAGPARRWGSAALLTVERTDRARQAAPVKLSLDYSAFKEAAGGGYGSRLALIELPACAASRAPGGKTCDAAAKRIPFQNDPRTHTLTAEVSAAAAGSAPAVYAVAAGDASSKGDYKATTLAPSASWSVANSSGGFSWDYPIRMIPTPGGFTPTVGLSYSSQSADGRTAATNNQGSWLGEGFSYEPGYIERAYKPCSEDGHTTSAEQCWAFDNATIMLNGMSGELVQDDTTKKWHLSSDSGAKIEKLPGADNNDNDGEHWKLTTTDGTEYHFGSDKLPGWTEGKERTSSTWTAPVFGDDPGEPCYNATFANAHCKQAWRWNLDYVKDTHGNVMSYFYGAETNHYALNGKTDVNGTAYHRGGYLKRIDYGQRDNAVYTTKAPAQVVFDTLERCIPDTGFDCDEAKLTPANAARWPDTPVDRLCKPGTKCSPAQSSQTFWTTKRLVGITTRMSTGPAATAWADVDAWKFEHFFTDNGDDTKTLWLSKIDHEGRVGGSAKLPTLELNGEHRRNRVDSDTDNVDAINRIRLVSVLSETGAQLDVTYAPADCSATALPKPGESTKRCYPVVWAPPGTLVPRTDWFHKYVVERVTQTDRTGGGDDLVTQYAYQGNAGWRHAEPDGITDEKLLTWGQWQGYGKVSVTGGNGQTMTTRVDYTYLQGLDGDKLPGTGTGTRTEKGTDSTGAEFTGHKEFTGFEIEAKTYNGTKIVSKTISEPWKHVTATQTRTWKDESGKPVTKTSNATIVKTETSRGYTDLPDGSWRRSKSVSTFDTAQPNPTGRLLRTDELGDLADDNDNTCTRLWYADNPARNIYELPSRSETVAAGCDAPVNRKTQVIADERTAYDNKAVGAAPERGLATSTERLTSHDGTTGTYQVTGTTAYDVFGRPTLQKDASKGPGTKTEYTDVNGLISKVKATNALSHVTTTDYLPAWGVSTGQTDPNGKRTDLAYDPLGRLTSVWYADRAKSQNPSIKYTYNIRKNAAVSVKTEKIENDGTYGVEYQLYDSLLRPRQKQAEGPNGSRMVGEVFYDGAGKVKKSNATFNATGAPRDTLDTFANGEVGAQTLSEYDGLGRTTAEIAQLAGVEQWRTTFTHEGDRLHIDPPQGGVPTTSITNIRGKVTELRHYRTAAPQPSGPGSQYDATKYTYDAADRLASLTDPEGNTWKYDYDQLGRQTASHDPDTGTTRTTYDELDRPASVTDARDKKVSTVYDPLGRPVTTWSGEPTTGTKLTETYYDKAGWLGHPWASLRWTSATEYFASITQDMDALYRVEKTAYTVPASEGKLAGTYVFTTSYNADGSVKGQGMPAAGGLTGEAVAFGYDELQRPLSMTGKTSYVTDTQYTPTSQLKALHLSTGTGKKIQQTFRYEKGTDRLTHSTVDVEGVNGPLKSVGYSYDQHGNVLSVADTARPEAVDVQCVDLDYQYRMTGAWTPAATQTTGAGEGTVGGVSGGARPAACASAAGSAPLGGPAPYWKSYTFDKVGNRLTETAHDTGLDPLKDVKRTYTYADADGDGTPGEPGDGGPHAVTKVETSTPTGDGLRTYAYDAAGNTTKRAVGGDAQSIEWDITGKPVKLTEANGTTTTNVYDAGGSRVLRRDANATTLYLPGMELRLPTGSTTPEATRYYGFAGQTIAVRTNDNKLTYLASDHHGTAELAIDPATGTHTQRRMEPYGAPRGTQPDKGAWPGEKGFVGGTIDESTGLTQIGARQFDPLLGKFISPDPVIDHNDPQQLNAYAYSHNRPFTSSDPTGLRDPEEVSYCQSHPSSCNGGGVKKNETSAQKNQNHAQDNRNRAEANLVQSKQQVKDTAKALIKIVKDLIGVDAALDCFSSGDLGSCGETLLNVAGSFAGGLAGKILAKYGAPWNWAKGARLAKRVVGLVDDLIGGVNAVRKNSKALSKAEEALATARAKAKSMVRKGDSADGPGCMTGQKHSFLPGTKVLMADGSTKPIEKVELRDRIIVTDPETGRTTVREVAGTITTEDDKHFVDLNLTTGNGTAEELTSTTTHPFWSVSEGAWIEAGDLKPGMTLRTAKADTVTVAAVHQYNKRQRTHDLTISEIHTYYVLAGATPVLVHNCDTGGLSLSGARQVSGRFPKTANPGETLFRQKDDGTVTAYARYDEEGAIYQRADLDPGSAPHAGIPAPHILDMAKHVNPKTGQVFRNWEKLPRPLRPEEELCGCR
ncbi:polymorphic toxin-type HINT domain-containing protein [Streptomyces sp. NPDC050504]|uniref:polymorphic toxin-type HINT domain-containing protein n=1 Tax=Streptomyces sp. NPDC050504 TaxID=3365618 RepID=UPI0037B62AA8